MVPRNFVLVTPSKKLLREPFVCQMLTKEYKSVVNISGNIKFFCVHPQGIFMPLEPLMFQVGSSNVGQRRRNLAANG